MNVLESTWCRLSEYKFLEHEFEYLYFNKTLRFDFWVRKIFWRRKCNSLQYSCLKNPMNRGAWWASVQSVRHDWAHTLSICHIDTILENLLLKIISDLHSCCHYHLYSWDLSIAFLCISNWHTNCSDFFRHIISLIL